MFFVHNFSKHFFNFGNALDTQLSTEQVQEKIANGVAIIDVRRVDEYEKYGVIANAYKLTFLMKKAIMTPKNGLKICQKLSKIKMMNLF
ncbi:hypothetical protein CRYPA_30 [uncultured Candidatus Thioglobus sp.]|nr:hypothetical protein CRYPA_30 [uncultured Candidatus Thioglobus sp.]